MLLVEESRLPLSIPMPGITDEQFQELCENYSDYFLEYTADGDLLIMPPTDRNTSGRNSEIIFQLKLWVRVFGRGLVTDSSGGFILPNGARRSPDAAWMSEERRDQEIICPEFIVELLSPGDRLNTAKAKMREWISNGAELAWLINPRTRTVTIYRPSQEPEERINITELAGEGPVDGFILDLKPVWDLT
jgi:Uma2 family endonuclease